MYRNLHRSTACISRGCSLYTICIYHHLLYVLAAAVCELRCAVNIWNASIVTARIRIAVILEANDGDAERDVFLRWIQKCRGVKSSQQLIENTSVLVSFFFRFSFFFFRFFYATMCEWANEERVCVFVCAREHQNAIFPFWLYNEHKDDDTNVTRESCTVRTYGWNRFGNKYAKRRMSPRERKRRKKKNRR